MDKQLVLERHVHCTNPLWTGHDVDVVLNFSPAINWDCAATNAACWPRATSNGINASALFSALRLVDVVHDTVVNFPQIDGWFAMKHPHEKNGHIPHHSRRRDPGNIAARETRSKALIPRQDCGFRVSFRQTVQCVAPRTHNQLWLRERIEMGQWPLSRAQPIVSPWFCQPDVESRPQRRCL